MRVAGVVSVGIVLGLLLVAQPILATIGYPQLALGGGFDVVIIVSNNSAIAWQGQGLLRQVASGIFTHWIAFNVPPDVRFLLEREASDDLFGGIRQGRNDFGVNRYSGPARHRALHIATSSGSMPSI